MEISNARIIRTTLEEKDHGILTAVLFLDYGDTTQGFRGHSFDKRDAARGSDTAWGIEFICHVLEVLEVDSWEKLPGTYCRVRRGFITIQAIGHIIKDQWFDPKELDYLLEEPCAHS